jgi:hypothetical protein
MVFVVSVANAVGDVPAPSRRANANVAYAESFDVTALEPVRLMLVRVPARGEVPTTNSVLASVPPLSARQIMRIGTLEEILLTCAAMSVGRKSLTLRVAAIMRAPAF